VYITKELFIAYAETIQSKVLLGTLSTAYAHNLISSVNVAMFAFRGNKSIWLSPLKFFGPRCHIRKVAPNISLVSARYACKEIRKVAGDDIALLIWLARLMGLRLKEAILLDANVALKQSKTMGKVDIRKGTKGGRDNKVERLIDSTKRIEFALTLATVSQSKRHSFIPDNEKLITFY
jgi:hypothetical protein